MEIPNRIITIGELRHHNGDDSETKWIAHNGIVYDVSDCPKWRSELHERMHFPGQDLTSELQDAPHTDGVFNRPCVKIVGKLQGSVQQFQSGMT